MNDLRTGPAVSGSPAASFAPSLPSSAIPPVGLPATSGAAGVAPRLDNIGSSPAPAARPDTKYVPSPPLPRSAFAAANSQLDAALSLAGSAAVDGKSLSLVDLVEQFPSRSRRTDAVQEYWKTAIAALDLRFAEDEFVAIQRSTAPDSSLKRSALATARARLAEAKMEYRRQREELAGRYGIGADETLPVPIDRPFLGPYDTKFLEIFSGRRPSRDAIELDRLISESAELAAARGEAAAHAADARDRAGATSTQEYLAAFDRCRDSRIAFLAAVRDYNLAIANYALFVSDPSLPAASVAKMLVDAPAIASNPIASLSADDRPALSVSLLEQSIIPASPATVSGIQPATVNLPVDVSEPTPAISGESPDASSDAGVLAPSGDDLPLPPADFDPTANGLSDLELSGLQDLGIAAPDAGLVPADDLLTPQDKPAAKAGSLSETSPAIPAGPTFSGAAIR